MSPECTLFSSLQRLRKTEVPADELSEAIECVNFCVDVAMYQIRKGRYFYFEHPLAASSWQLDSLSGLMTTEGVENVVVHMCRFNLRSRDSVGDDGLSKKPTRVLTNLPSLAESINKKCTGDHDHIHLVGGRAKAAAQYTREFCNAIIDGILVLLEHMAATRKLGPALYECELYDGNEEGYDYGDADFYFSGDGYCVDDVKGGTLPMEMVREGRRAEMQGFAERKVYEVRPRLEAQAKGAKVIGVRWVDTAKAGKVRS